MTHRSQRDPCLELWPRRRLSALECSLGVRPAHAQSLSAEGREATLGDGWQLELAEQLSTAIAEEVDDIGLDAVFAQQRMDLSLEFGAHADQGGTHAYQSATLTHIGRSDP